ncbi:hypothetical protein Tco_1227016, partial [Tanacetum coccineum]
GYEENLKHQTKLDKKNDMTEKAVYNELSKRCSRLENQDAPGFKDFFIINELQAQLEAKHVSIAKLKDHIAKIKGKNVVERVSSSTKASGSKPRSNTKKDMILQTSCNNKKTNQVESQPKIAKSSLNNTNRVSKTVCNENVKHPFIKRTHNNQDPPNDREGENRKKRRKDVVEPSSRSSRKYTTPMNHPNPGWFTKKLGSANAKRRTTWFDLLLKSDIDQNEDHILGPSTVAIEKKLKELIQKDVLTIADLEGARLEKLKQHYKNVVELEYHVDQLKAAVLSEA